MEPGGIEPMTTRTESERTNLSAACSQLYVKILDKYIRKTIPLLTRVRRMRARVMHYSLRLGTAVHIITVGILFYKLSEIPLSGGKATNIKII